MGGRHRPLRGAPRTPWWARLCVWFGAVLMFGSGGLLVGGSLVLSNLSSNVHTDNLLHRPAEELELVAVRHDHHGPRTEGA